ncbi:MAG: hypothetical protein UY31_C0038G0004 [Candidatus Wolfebacteria bacterium GW2011_GWE1_48_7]|uniref:Uncharacterized protein n=2 Tax=Candidatus Wolfeibacteriota TaxID=1752735 RepID=A0A0G1WGB0_9BACT|nr:MAG: hypothetical protein UX70_C0001G1023 [Candidatus Wolfebacteria bacterium GW2011_GWB1_47_1]KKU36627.1 MAG: hypothetical protein UX49_C0012G0008 [Candidatus Wolfebacteria bacterium GW2011_GWC2_46_275]KKU41475.1 MAG: hypothetical protein UX58_C0008G0041 [Candidatus Wolfebacteria bacterium GW2011_GWB2_46_69]KKU53585.1 MAG: hypothetical protein UX76_C0013G0013 [Candidatus Wolfebacteria bacterium GW2011_GWC1_47_103]KKU58816.1 MAG: hypothetical protein UX83_C0011G0028 [Candidatus Wolfebacteria
MRIPVFLYKKDHSQVGSGVYEMIACFCALGVHIPFSYYAHAGDHDLESVGEPITCDGSCKDNPGSFKDFSQKRDFHDYEVKRIIEAATSFSSRMRSRASA